MNYLMSYCLVKSGRKSTECDRKWSRSEIIFAFGFDQIRPDSTQFDYFFTMFPLDLISVVKTPSFSRDLIKWV